MQIIDLVPDLKPTILAARQARDARNSLARFLPYRETQSVSYRLGRRQRADQTVPVRAIDAPAVPIRRPGLVDVRGDLPAITPIVDLSEQDLTNEMVLARQLAGLAVDWTDAVNASAVLAALTVDNTFEAMRGQVLATLELAIESADGVTHEVDFGAGADQITTVTTPWNAAGGDAFADFAAAHSAHIDRAGDVAGVALTTSRVKRQLLAALGARYPQQPVDVNTLNAYLTANDLPQVYTYDRTFTAYDGTKTRVYPEGNLTFLPGAEDPVGRTELGVTQEAVQQVNRLQPNGRPALSASEAPGVTIVTLGKDNPVQRSVKAAAIGMPVLHDADQISVITGIFG
ncbi:MAG: major capsid protein [Propionibacteriaceae bacterium]|nr:major capsid protein [Propionibacteriaceae bacterium]